MSARSGRTAQRDDERPPLAERVASGTTRLILIAIVAGGLLTVAVNLGRMRSSENDAPLTDTDAVALPDDLIREGFPVTHRVINGDEAAARDAVVQTCREKIDDAARRVVSLQTRANPAVPPDEPFENAVELDRDPGGKWSIHQLQDLRRLIVGVGRAGSEPTILFWGGYDETGPGQWTTWTMLLPLPEK